MKIIEHRFARDPLVDLHDVMIDSRRLGLLRILLYTLFKTPFT